MIRGLALNSEMPAGRETPAGQPPRLAPTCAACGKPMHYSHTYPDKTDVTRDEHFYACDCGQEQSIVAPRE
jgi:hypothetical protein